MRCRIGDLAVIVRGINSGRLVTVLGPSICGPAEWFVECLGRPMPGIIGGAWTYSQRGSIEDARLRPIRDGEGQDESLSWAVVPRPATALCGNRGAATPQHAQKQR